MNMKRTVAAAIAALALTGPAIAGPVMNDLEVAHAAYTADEIDIRYGHLALALSKNASVREFAQTMIRDHTAVNAAAVALLTELKVQPQDNELSMALVKGSESKILELSGLTGHAFDCAYAKNELGYHTVVNKTVADTFVPQVTVAPLGELLADAQVTFNQHEVLAKKMVAGLNCSS